MSYSDGVYMEQQANKLVITSTGELQNDGTISSTGTINIESGGVLNSSGTINTYKKVNINSGSTVEVDGTLKIDAGLIYESTGKWLDIKAPVTSLRVGPTKSPGFEIVFTGGSTDGVRAYKFDKATEEQLYFVLQVNHDWKLGTNLNPHVHWLSTSTHAGSAVWGLEYTWQEGNKAFGNTVVIKTTEVSAGQNIHNITSFSAISTTIGTHSSMIMCRIFRDATATGDTLDNDAVLLEVDFHFRKGQQGSVTELGT